MEEEECAQEETRSQELFAALEEAGQAEMLALQQRANGMVRRLHEHNANLDHPAVTKDGQLVLAPLHAAAAQGHTDCR